MVHTDSCPVLGRGLTATRWQGRAVGPSWRSWSVHYLELCCSHSPWNTPRLVLLMTGDFNGRRETEAARQRLTGSLPLPARPALGNTFQLSVEINHLKWEISAKWRLIGPALCSRQLSEHKLHLSLTNICDPPKLVLTVKKMTHKNSNLAWFKSEVIMSYTEQQFDGWICRIVLSYINIISVTVSVNNYR